MHIIFVESGGRGDFYFNYAHNCNVGIKRAMDYNPKWVIVSNDDMYKIDSSQKLLKQILNFNQESYDTLYLNAPSKKESAVCNLSIPNFLKLIVYHLIPEFKTLKTLEYKFKVSLFDMNIEVWKKYFYKRGYIHLSIGQFGIFSSSFIIKNNIDIFNEVFINAGEDIELSLKLFRGNYDFIDYRIGDKKDGTLGFNNLRKLRDVSGQSYLNYLISNHPNEYFRDEFINSKFYLRLKGKNYE